MLNRLLELLQVGGTRRIADLASELDTTSALVEVMLEDLCRMGVLKRVDGQCGDACGECPMTGLCAAGSQGQLWVLMEEQGG
jgi:hypothetical protein